MEKLKEYKVIIIITLVILGGAFYWLSLRQVLIKKNCFWFTEITPATEGMSKAQFETTKKVAEETCNQDSKVNTNYEYNVSWNRTCNIPDAKLMLPQPEKKEIREATKSEYDNCLRRNGL